MDRDDWLKAAERVLSQAEEVMWAAPDWGELNCVFVDRPYPDAEPPYKGICAALNRLIDEIEGVKSDREGADIALGKEVESVKREMVALCGGLA